VFFLISIIQDIFQDEDEDQKKTIDKNQANFKKQPSKTNELD